MKTDSSLHAELKNVIDDRFFGMLCHSHISGSEKWAFVFLRKTCIIILFWELLERVDHSHLVRI